MPSKPVPVPTAVIAEGFAKWREGRPLRGVAKLLHVKHERLKAAMQGADAGEYRRLVEAHQHAKGKAHRPGRGWVFRRHDQSPPTDAAAQDARVRAEVLAKFPVRTLEDIRHDARRGADEVARIEARAREVLGHA